MTKADEIVSEFEESLKDTPPCCTQAMVKALRFSRLLGRAQEIDALAEVFISWCDGTCSNCSVPVTFWKMVDSSTESGFKYECRNGYAGQYTRAMDPEESTVAGRRQ